MALIVAGVNHRTAPIEIREKLALASSEIAPVLEKLKGESGAREAVVLTTCNRTEFWMVEGARSASSLIGQLMSERLGADASSYMYVHQDRDAVSHLFRQRRIGSRFDDTRRGADSWAGTRRVGELPNVFGSCAQPSLPNGFDGWLKSSRRNRNRKRRGIGQLCRGAAREEDLWIARRAARNGPRRW